MPCGATVLAKLGAMATKTSTLSHFFNITGLNHYDRVELKNS